MNLRFAIILTLFLVLGKLNFAQLDNRPFYRYQTIDSTKENELYLSISHLSFNKDNEYFNSIADGYTLFGNQLSTSLIYFPAKNVRLEGGIYLRKDFGNDSYSTIAPLMSIKVLHEDISLTFGNFEGSLNHNLIEPLYDFEKIMLDRLENGIQLQLNKNKFDLDFWLNWENMLYRGDSTQEKVSGGLSTEYNIVDLAGFSLSIPLQITAMHLGGQIDASPLPLTTKVNGTGGFKLQMDYQNSFIEAFSIEPYYLFYKDASFKYQDAYSSGNALYLNFSLKTKLNTIMISYWQGNKYISTHGGLLYYSRSTTYKYPNYTEPNRKLLIIRFLTDIKVFDKLYITSRFEPLYDFHRKKIEFSLGLYFNYADDFFLKKVIN